MSHEDLEPGEAHERLASNDGALYIDVRSESEFAQGHPTGAWNLPILHLGAAGMQPNADFAAVAEAVLPKDRLLVVGCKAGGRSARACGVLAGLGFRQLVNVAGGFHGAHHPMTGELLIPGWEACGLPVSLAPEPGRSWEELRARLG